MLMSKTKVKQQRSVVGLHSFINNVSNFFAESVNGFQILEVSLIGFFLFTI